MTAEPTLRLLNINPEVARLARDAAAFERAQGASFGGEAETIRGVVEASESFRSRNGAPPEWGGYLAIDPKKGRVVGTCAFKGSPIDGVAEIAFFTFEPYGGKGYATAMVSELIRICEPTPAVRKLIALSMPEENAATAVLQKNGFQKVGQKIDPEDGLLWRWERWK